MDGEQIPKVLDCCEAGGPVVLEGFVPDRSAIEWTDATWNPDFTPIAAYDRYKTWNPATEHDLLTAHETLMAGLLPAPGRYRAGPVVVMGQGEVEHIGPPARRVPGLMEDLLAWVGATDEHPLVASSVFHYEFEFIHPFDDGNGRLGRLWQTLILTRWKTLFADVPVESLVHAGDDPAGFAKSEESEVSPYPTRTKRSTRDHRLCLTGDRPATGTPSPSPARRPRPRA